MRSSQWASLLLRLQACRVLKVTTNYYLTIGSSMILSDGPITDTILLVAACKRLPLAAVYENRPRLQ
jgi:hypothetical protein